MASCVEPHITLSRMTTSHATIARRRVRITGHPHSGWSAAEPNDPHFIELDFRFDITDDGKENYLLVYSSLDSQYAADSWHETIAEAVACARETFGIESAEWSQPPKSKSGNA